jgi:hypothetical protein
MRFIGKRSASRAACAVVCKRWNTFAAPYSRVRRMPLLAKSTATASGTTASAAAVSSGAADLLQAAENTDHATQDTAATDSVKGKARPKRKPKSKAAQQRMRNAASR